MTSGPYAARNRPRRLSVVWLLAGMLAVFVLWAAFFEIEQTVRATGQVIPQSRTQVIQAADGGVLEEILVREGQAVKAGQVLARLEVSRAQAGYSESQAKVMSLRAAMRRAQAELDGRPPGFGPEFDAYRGFADAQTGLYHQRRRALEENIGALASSLQIAEDELAMGKRLEESGDIARTEVMRAQRQVYDLRARVAEARNRYQTEARQELAKLEDELSSARFKFDERESLLEHTVITAPTPGIVKVVRLTTVGGVLHAGDELMQISPTDSEVLVELKINPADVGSLQEGLPVALRFDAFDASLYGKRNGTLGFISPDTLNEQVGDQVQAYYRAHVRIMPCTPDPSCPGERIRPADIKPGLTVTADITTGSRTVLHYLLKPVYKAFDGALSQR